MRQIARDLGVKICAKKCEEAAMEVAICDRHLQSAHRTIKWWKRIHEFAKAQLASDIAKANFLAEFHGPK